MTEIRTLPRRPSKRRSAIVGLPWIVVAVAVLGTIAYVNKDRYLAPAPARFVRSFDICGEFCAD
jgi:hypothetical protein